MFSLSREIDGTEIQYITLNGSCRSMVNEMAIALVERGL